MNNDFLSNQGGHDLQHPPAVYKDYQGKIQDGTDLSHPPYLENLQAHSGIKPGYEDCIQQQCPPQMPNMIYQLPHYDPMPQIHNMLGHGFQNTALLPAVSQNPTTVKDVTLYHNIATEPNGCNIMNCGQPLIPTLNQNQTPVYVNQVPYNPNQVSPHQAASPVSMNRPTSPQAMLYVAQMGQVKYPMHAYQNPSPSRDGNCTSPSTISTAWNCTPTGTISSTGSCTPTSAISVTGSCTSSNTTSSTGGCTPTSTLSRDWNGTPASNISETGNSTPSSTISQESTGREDSDIEDKSSMSELEKFAQDIKRRRYKLGFTQENVGDGLGVLYNKHFSQTTVCRFEACQLSLTNMRKLKPVLEKWFHEVETNPSSRAIVDRGEKPKNSTKTKSRTFIDEETKKVLELSFTECAHPSKSNIEDISTTTKLKCKVIRNWFCNRRQKEKKDLKIHLKERAIASGNFVQPIPAPNTGNCVMPPMAVPQPYLINMTGSNHTPFMATNNQNGKFIQHAMQRMPPGYYTQ
ncbi:POU domain, class 3, transcription factor 4 [Pelobates cultripes]|uniref:POU domain, class 3, transcription factor 4 n=1 Tax=Pelobates cultripes TaxID=61616 RepID=A0AAD1QZD7_PELCU|nr:POU domain, class 3, transcription factor 4 [Pelobates cultripes]